MSGSAGLSTQTFFTQGVDDYKAYAQLGPVIDGELAMGFKYSGSYCGAWVAAGSATEGQSG